MSYISTKKRSKNFIAPTVVLAAGITVGSQTLVASADTTTTSTGWDTSSTSANISDANSAIASASSSASAIASSTASANTSSAAKVSGSSTIGWVDVYVDHSKLDDAITNAASKGINIQHDNTVIQAGDASATATNTSAAAAYYASQAAAISSTASQYTTDMANYDASVAQNKSNADSANAQMDGLRTNLAAQGQTTTVQSKTYSSSAVASDTAAVQQQIADGKTYLQAKNAVTNATNQQNSMTLFTTAAAQGNVKLAHQTVTIASQADADKYIANLNTEYAAMQTYLDSIATQTGTIPDSDKPTYTLYNFVVDSTVESKGTTPVTTYNYTPVAVTKPVTPTVSYHYYDIRSQPTSTSGFDNADGETIVSSSNSNAGGNVVAQAMVNQTVAIDTDNQPLPADRFDKIQNLTIVTKLPKDVTFDMDASNTDPTNWTISYDSASNTVTQTATAAYLVQLNLNQSTNNSGSVGGTTDGTWAYHAPQVYFKLLNDNETYQASSTTYVNNEYEYVGQGVQIRTDSANPTKANSNSIYQNIDGKAVLPGSINNYIIGWDFDQYKNVNIDSKMQSAGLRLIDDYPEDAVSLTGPISIVDPTTGDVYYSATIPTGTTLGSTGTFNDANGKEVSGLTWTVIDNDTAPSDMKGKLSGYALMISYVGDDSSFYKEFVQGGKSLNVVLPMTTLEKTDTTSTADNEYNGNTYSNVAWQSDFGNDYESNTVTNTAPLLNPTKDAVLSYSNLTSLDINNNATASIEDGSNFKYRLEGSKLPTNLSEDITSYALVDNLATDSDAYDGTFLVQNDSVITFKAGSTLAKRYPNGIAAGSDISKYFTQTIARNSDGTKINTVTLTADADFLSQIDYSKTNYQVDAFLTTQRISTNQGVTNQFNEVINGITFKSNTVITNSSENALDKLQDELNSLSSSANSGIASNSATTSSMVSALSVIVKNINSVKDSTSSAVSSVASQASSAASVSQSYFNYTSEQISLVSKQVTDTASSVASSASSAMASNSTSMASVASSVASQMSSVASTTNKAITSLAASLAAATDQSLSTMTIYDSAVKSDADALSYAVNQGVAAGSIKSIELNSNNKYVVTYNTSKTGINNSKAIS